MVVHCDENTRAPQRLLQDRLGQHVVLQGLQYACLCLLNNRLMWAAQLHDQDLKPQKVANRKSTVKSAR